MDEVQNVLVLGCGATWVSDERSFTFRGIFVEYIVFIVVELVVDIAKI